jgi:F0F1-type ATP synthase membrane subunit b/b'
MKYAKTTVAAAFVAGYILKSVISPSSPEALLSKLEEKLTKDPVRYEQVIDRARESAHQLKAAANPHPTKPGYVQFKDLRLVLMEEKDGDLTFLVNKHTSEHKEIKYVNGRTAVGSYKDRLESLQYEAIQEGRELVVGAKEKAEKYTNQVKDTAKKSVDKISELYNNAKEKFVSFYECVSDIFSKREPKETETPDKKVDK